MKVIWQFFQPNKILSKSTVRLMVLTQVVVFLLIWIFAHTIFLPKPGEILTAFTYLWNEEGLGGELITSLLLNIEAIWLATAVSLLLAYASVLPFFRPIVAMIGKLRFLSLAGLTFFFTLMASTGHELKVYLLVFSVSTFFITSMADVISNVPKESFDLARTLGMSEWRTTFEVIVLGQADKAFDVMRQNAAIGWMMLTMVEGISREGGGIATLLLNQSKHFHLDAIFAIQITILFLGLGQDYVIGLLRNTVCPYANLTLERR